MRPADVLVAAMLTPVHLSGTPFPWDGHAVPWDSGSATGTPCARNGADAVECPGVSPAVPSTLGDLQLAVHRRLHAAQPAGKLGFRKEMMTVCPTQIGPGAALASSALSKTAEGFLLAAVPEFLGSLAAAFVVTLATWGLHRLRRRVLSSERDRDKR